MVRPMRKVRLGTRNVATCTRQRLRGTLLLVSSLGACSLHCSDDDAGSGSSTTSSGGSVGGDGTASGGSAGETPSSATSSDAGGSSNGGSSNGGSSSGGSSNGGGAAGNGSGGNNATTTNDTGSGGVGGSSAGGTAGLGGEAGAGPEPIDGPVLDDLVIDGARYPLMPDFTPGRLRFSVLPSDPVEELEVTAVAAADLEITIDGEPATSGEPVALPDLEPESEFEVTVEDGSGERRTYTVLYLPQDFPEFTVIAHESGASDDPLYLSPHRDGMGYAIQLDNAGVPLFYRRALGAQDFKRHPNGWRSYSEVDSPTSRQIILDENFTEIDEVEAVGYNVTDQHDFHILANGNYVLIARQAVDQDLTPYGGAADGRVLNQIFQELTPEDEVEFEWNTWGNVNYEDNLTGSATDYAHANGIAIDPEGNWLLSFRHTAQIFKIDRATGDVIWRLGGVSSDFDFVDDPLGGLCGQHTPSLLENGNLLIFDNGAPCPPDIPERVGYTRIVEYELDEVEMTAKLVYSHHREGPASTTQGSAQRLPNGNTLIGWGGINIPRMATELDPDGNIVFELEATLLDSEHPVSYRAYRFPD